MTNSARTQAFLRMIARRLSGREDCRRKEFLIGIGVPLPDSLVNLPEGETGEHYIFFNPDIQVYKDMYHRKDKDLHRVADLMLNRYFPELVLGRDDYGQLRVDTSQLSIGVYEYQMSMDGKRRRWVRMPLNRYVTKETD